MKTTVFANNLRKLRLEKAYTQERAAELLGVSPQSVSRWECGNTLPDVLLLPEIAKIYGVTVDDLYKEDTFAYPNYAQRLLAVFEATGNSEDFLRAEKEFQQLLAAGTHTADDLRSCGVLYQYMMLGCMKQAQRCFDRAIAAAEGSDEAIWCRTWQQKISFLADIGKSAESIAAQKAALQTNQKKPAQWLLLVAAYFFAGQHEQARACVKEALERFPEHAALHVYAGDICRALKAYDAAFDHWNRALALEDDWLDARYSMGFCYEELGQYEMAYHIWMALADLLERRGMVIEKDIPLKLAEKCREKMP